MLLDEGRFTDGPYDAEPPAGTGIKLPEYPL